MKEIKFRGNLVGNNSSVTGDLIRDAYIQDNQHIDCCIFENGDFYEVDPNTIRQYVGTKDKNGIEIFEGDIVKKYIELYDIKRTESTTDDFNKNYKGYLFYRVAWFPDENITPIKYGFNLIPISKINSYIERDYEYPKGHYKEVSRHHYSSFSVWKKEQNDIEVIGNIYEPIANKHKL